MKKWELAFADRAGKEPWPLGYKTLFNNSLTTDMDGERSRYKLMHVMLTDPHYPPANPACQPPAQDQVQAPVLPAGARAPGAQRRRAAAARMDDGPEGVPAPGARKRQRPRAQPMEQPAAPEPMRRSGRTARAPPRYDDQLPEEVMDDLMREQGFEELVSEVEDGEFEGCEGSDSDGGWSGDGDYED